jgi:hypothetical protein
MTTGNSTPELSLVAVSPKPRRSIEDAKAGEGGQNFVQRSTLIFNNSIFCTRLLFLNPHCTQRAKKIWSSLTTY